MAETVVILSADSWGMTDEKTGQVLAGVSVWYVNDYREDSAESFGLKPTKISCSPEVFAALKANKLPGRFELEFGAKPGAGNKATLILNGVRHVGEVDLFPVVPVKKAA